MILFAGLSSGCARPYVFPAGTAQLSPKLYDDRVVMDDAYTLPVRHWGDPLKSKAIILAIHGLNDYSYGFESTGKYLAAQNILFFSYDQRGFGATKGHGTWHGSQRMIKDNQQIVRLLHEKYPEKPLFLLGESMGGAVALASFDASTNKNDNGIEGSILIAPAIWSRKTMPWYQRALLWLAVHTVPDKALTGEGLDLMPSDNIEMLRALGRDPLVIKATRVDVLYGVTNLMDLAAVAPTGLTKKSLILYGKHDQIVPRKPTCKWLKSLPEEILKNTILYDNGYHMLNRDLQAQQVLGDIANWVSLVSTKSQDEAIDITSLPGYSGSAQSLSNFCVE
ncbi:MAG: alpha/beta fold hydrolase [Pseudomonadota bacterium]|nr:alpha/beta fold hydrolase [Pseudomonadota bacterium]